MFRIFVWPLLVVLLPLANAFAGDDEGLPLEGETTLLELNVAEASWVSVSVVPGEDRFVFDLLGDLYSLPLAGGEATPITQGPGFDSQPAVSPDGERLAFISDRDGSDNLWIASLDGNDPRKLSDEQYNNLISPAWSPDSKFLIVTRDADEVELVLFSIDGGSGVVLTDITEEMPGGVGAVFSPDGDYLYYAARARSNGPVDDFPVTQVFRIHLDTGVTEQVTRGEGGGFRPRLSSDGRLLVYGTRHEAQTGLRVRHLETGADRWVTLPVQFDTQENFRPSSRGLLPGYAILPGDDSLLLSADGRFQRVDLATGTRSELAFTANVALEIGPDLTAPWRVPQGPLTATLVQDPVVSPDGETIAASVLTRIHVLEAGETEPRALTPADLWAFKPAWSPDGRHLAFVSWTANDGGHVFRVRANGRGLERLTDYPAFYTDLVWAPDGETLYAMRGNEWMRHQTFSEFTGLGIPLELVSIPARGGGASVIMPAGDARYPHFGPEADRIYLYDGKALFSVAIDGTDRRDHLIVEAPRGNRNSEDPPTAEEIRISPAGDVAVAHVAKQVWAVPIVRAAATVPTVAVASGGALPAARLTDIGADYLGWTPDGEAVVWAIGSTVFRRPLSSVEFYEDEDEEDEEEDEQEDGKGDKADGEDEEAEEPFVPLDEHEAVLATRFAVEVPRDTPAGELLLVGGTVITMAGASTADMARPRRAAILIRDNRIAEVAPLSEMTVPDGVTRIDISGQFVVPGFIDTHAHWEFRTDDVLEPTNWTLAANLAYGVTAGLDVQTSYHDYFVYRDFVETGRSVGSRAFMTGPGIFGNNDFESYDAVESYLRRYSDHYRTPNIKAYLSGNREQRQWIVQASRNLGLLPTTEGGGDQKLNLTHAIDGMHGNEHNMPDTPFFEDVVQLYARTRTAYTPTLIVQYNAEAAREYFFTRTNVHDDPKLQRFYPHNRLDELTRRRPGWMRDEQFRFEEGAAAATALQRAGGLVGVGGHAELQGLGYHWEMWTYAMGGMTPAEVLRAATIDGAHILGAPDDLGSIESGKLADLVILDENPLEDIRHTNSVSRVMKNGRLYDGDTLDEQWPRERSLPAFWWWDATDRRYFPSPATD